MAINPNAAGLWAALRDPRFAPSQRAQAVAGLGGTPQIDLASAFQLGDEYGAEEEEVAGGGMGGMGGVPGMTGDSTGISDLHPALIEMTRQAMLDDSPVTSEDKGLALAKAGFAMAAGDSPHALQNIGRGAMVGAESLQQMRQQRALQRMREVQAQAALARAMRPNTAQMSPLGQLISERDSLPEGDQRRAAYDAAITRASEGAGGGDPVFKQQIEALRAANPGMSVQEATNIILQGDTERTNRPQQGGLFQLEDGTRVPALFDPKSRQYQYRDADGNMVPLPFGASPATPSVGAPLNRKQYEDKKMEFLSNTQAIKKLDSYLRTVEDADQGFDLLADQVMAKFNTAFERGLTKEQFAAMESNAKLQSLLGLFRTDIVGPGAMTEYDAKRVLDALGGDITLLRNKEVVREVLQSMYENKLATVEMQKKNLSYSAPVFGESPDAFEIPEVQYLGKRKPRGKDDAGPQAGSGPDGGGAGAGSGGARQEWVRDPVTGKLRPK